MDGRESLGLDMEFTVLPEREERTAYLLWVTLVVPGTAYLPILSPGSAALGSAFLAMNPEWKTISTRLHEICVLPNKM